MATVNGYILEGGVIEKSVLISISETPSLIKKDAVFMLFVY